MSTYFADNAWLTHGFDEAVRMEVGISNLHGRGRLRSVNVQSEPSGAEYLGRYVVPGIPNTHSHAFQRAMAGLAERQTHADDSFWTWRETMYDFAGRLDPDSLKAIAAQLYVEMLKAGYTHVCEFHYLHHQPNGSPYSSTTAMSMALIEAAQEAGIGLTLLPTLYMTGGFDQRALSARQQRFAHQSLDAFLKMREQLRQLECATMKLGLAFHSLRAVPMDALLRVLDAEKSFTQPIHLHIAEQVAEVQECVEFHKARPVAYLLDQAPVNQNWTLVHATHLQSYEISGIAKSRANVSICPTTEANLGDGIFSLRDFINAGGVFSIGSDSHISVSPVEELRWLEYVQRLHAQKRNIACSETTASVGEFLFAQVLLGGERSAHAGVGVLEGVNKNHDGARADWLVLDHDSPLMAARFNAEIIDNWIFSGNQNLIRHVMVAGKWVVRDAEHIDEVRIADRYRKTMARLRANA